MCACVDDLNLIPVVIISSKSNSSSALFHFFFSLVVLCFVYTTVALLTVSGTCSGLSPCGIAIIMAQTHKCGVLSIATDAILFEAWRLWVVNPAPKFKASLSCPFAGVARWWLVGFLVDGVLSWLICLFSWLILRLFVCLFGQLIGWLVGRSFLTCYREERRH